MSQEKDDNRQACSQKVYDLLQAFNGLSSLDEQEEVLDVIYDALYHKAYRQVIKDRLIRQVNQENETLRQENENLREIFLNLEGKLRKTEEMLYNQGKKNLRATKRGLLIIVNNLKHYLGDSWYSIFPGGVDNVDAFIRKIDTEGIMSMDTWSRYIPESTSDSILGQTYENREETY